MGLPVTLIWIRPSPQCVRTAGRNKTLRRCGIRPLKEDNIMHMRATKCDEAFSVQTYQIWTNQYIMNSYIMLLIMREWFCLNALWKVKNYHEKKKFMMKHFIIFILKIKLLNYVYVPYYVLLWLSERKWSIFIQELIS